MGAQDNAARFRGRERLLPPGHSGCSYIMFKGIWHPCSKTEGFQDGEGRAVSQVQALYLVGSSAMHGVVEPALLPVGACAQKQEMHRICSPSMLMGESEQ